MGPYYKILCFFSLGLANLDIHSDNESINDLVSNCSNSSLEDENYANQDELVTRTEKYEEKLLQSIENATLKSAQIRTDALQAIYEVLQHRHIPDFIEDRKITMMDIIEKSIRRGKSSEQEWAIRLAPLLIIQLGRDEISSTLSQILIPALNNKSWSYSVRALSCTALAMLYFFSNVDNKDIVIVMQHLEQIFSGSYLKGDKSPPLINDEISQLHVSALEGWSLLATLIPPGQFCSLVKNCSILS